MSYKPWALAAGLLISWELVVRLFAIPSYTLPAPTAIGEVIWVRRDYLMQNVPATVYEVWIGFALALAAGLALAIPIALTKFGAQAVMPIVVATQSVPKTALAPLFVVWFGFGLLPKVVIAATIAFFPIVVNLVKGLQSVEPEMVQYLETLGARKSDIFFRLRLPSSAPFLFAALKVSISLATVGAVVGEFVGADEGLGYVILRAINNFDTPMMFAGLTLVSLVGVISYGIVALAERPFLSWQPTEVSATVTGA